ncbi:MAG: hypothetical protein PUG48_08715 [Clostridia bacterium]|nr:hypothetical protein [Clostridia bacterium]
MKNGYYDEEELAIDELLDDYIDSGKYKTTEDILSEKDLTEKQALDKADEFKKRFFDLLEIKDIKNRNISKICFEVSELSKTDKSDNVLFLCVCLLTENGLIFGDVEDKEDKIRLWYEQSETVQKLTELIKQEPVYRKRLEELKNYKPKDLSAKINQKEQTLLYKTATDYKFLSEYKDSDVFFENIGELVRMVNSDETYKQIKPYIYFAVLTRKHKLMTGHQGFIPNISNVFEYKKYRIDRDNNKNFNTYEAYLILYEEIFSLFENDGTDIEFNNYCMANLSNLCEWYYENCEHNEDIPINLSEAVGYFSKTVSLIPENFWFSRECEVMNVFVDKNPSVSRAYEEIMSDDEFLQSFVSAVQNDENNIDVYAEKMYDAVKNKLRVISRFKQQSVLFARLCLVEYLQDYNRSLLMNTVYHF